MLRNTTARIGAVEPGAGRRCAGLLLAGVLTLPLLAAGCASGEQGATDGGGEASPAATSPTPADDGAEGAAGDSETAEDRTPGPAQVSATVSGLVDEVAAVRGLQPQSEVEVELVGRQELGSIGRNIAERRAGDHLVDEEVLAALRFVPRGTDLVALQEKLLVAGGFGLYEPESDQLYVVAGDGALNPFRRAIITHEVTHALQDQHFGLQRENLAEGDPEAAQAFRYLVEGDAQAVQQEWVRVKLSAEEQQEFIRQRTSVGTGRQEELAELPQALRVDATLTYRVGAAFVRAVRDAQGPQAVNAAFADPPDTTVETIDPQLYLDGFEAREVSGLASPAPAWSQSMSATFGAHHVALMQSPLQAMQSELPTASQWRGGRLRAWRADDELAVGVTTTFAGDGAAAFCDRVRSWYRRQAQAQPAGENAFESDRDAMVVECGQGDVRFGIAPTVEDARAVIGG